MPNHSEPHHVTGPPARLVVLASGQGSTMAALLQAQRDPQSGIRVVGVISDIPTAGALQKAQADDVPCVVVDPADSPDRAHWNEALGRAIADFSPDWIVLAGFMRIISADVVHRFAGAIMNTHPSLLPAFPGAHAVRDALRAGVKITGCTVHVVDDGVDTGPILAQAAVSIHDTDDETTLHERIKVVERALLVDTVIAVARYGYQSHGRTARIQSPTGAS